mmetsp:Transcript_2788/g.6235  ORF Transcript_2788/g.6235 Transcript_2788/m.6235 type:complete len:102 (+) Transcript_2788:138-443(+)
MITLHHISSRYIEDEKAWNIGTRSSKYGGGSIRTSHFSISQRGGLCPPFFPPQDRRFFLFQNKNASVHLCTQYFSSSNDSSAAIRKYVVLPKSKVYSSSTA